MSWRPKHFLKAGWSFDPTSKYKTSKIKNQKFLGMTLIFYICTMSGGHFDYDQYRIENIASSIESQIERNGRKKTKNELDFRPDYYENYPDELYFHRYSDEVIDKFKEAVRILRIARTYAHRIDWLLSGDDCEETFLKRLDEELNKLK